MLAVTKEFKWEMAHRLEGHDGLCHGVHGHNYKLLLTVKKGVGEVFSDLNKSSEGMVCDFKFLKKIVNNVIVDSFDHAFAYNIKDKTSSEIADYLKKKINQKLAPFPFRLTAENMAKWIVEELNKRFAIGEHDLICIKAVLYETDTSYATYELQDESDIKEVIVRGDGD